MRNSPLAIGQVIDNVRYGRAVVTAIHGEQQPETIKKLAGVISTGGKASFDIVYFDSVRVKMVPESIVCGGQPWTVYDEILSPEELLSVINAAVEREEKAEQEKAAATAAYAVEKSRLRECPKYAFLKKMEDNKGSEVALVAGNIRKELKKEFPSVKFSVTSQHGTAVNIKWTDGPTKEAVSNITSKYQEGRFNGMEDIYEYNTSPFNDIFGGAKYIFWERKHTDELKAKAIELARKKFGSNAVPEHATVELYNKGGFWAIGREYFYNGLESEIGRILAELEA